MHRNRVIIKYPLEHLPKDETAEHRARQKLFVRKHKQDFGKRHWLRL